MNLPVEPSLNLYACDLGSFLVLRKKAFIYMTRSQECFLDFQFRVNNRNSSTLLSPSSFLATGCA